jgi:beta-fructofuranosidase
MGSENSRWTRRHFVGRGALLAGAWQMGLRRRLFAEALAVSAADLAKDPRRPQFHLLPAANWMNDPNGPIFWKGQYHMFFQYNPNGAYWGDMHWAHAVSPDMVHWRHLPVGLSPTPGGPDADGCFTGSAVVQDGVATLIYTGIAAAPKSQATLDDGKTAFRETQCIATCDQPMLGDWKKAPAPVIASPPPGMAVSGFRDPAPWRYWGSWYLCVGSGVRGKGGMILLYRSKDFRKWEYLHPLVEGTIPADSDRSKSATDPVGSGEMWECPDFFAIRDKFVLIYSTQGKVFWQSGVLDRASLKFQAEQSGLLDYGTYYAPKTQLDENGNRILWGWIPETRPIAEYRASGWAGLMSLPRLLDLDSKGMLVTRVSPAVEKLRGLEQSLNKSGTEAGDKKQIDAMRISDCCGELQCDASLTDEPFGFSLVRDDGSEHGKDLFAVEWQPQGAKLLLDGKEIPAGVDRQSGLQLHAFVDGSAVEFFINGRAACTRRFYYVGDKAPEIRVGVKGSVQGIKQLRLWQITPISSDRLTGESS